MTTAGVIVGSAGSAGGPGFAGGDSATRIEKDALGEVKVAANHLWGAQTQRSITNFKIAIDDKMPMEVIQGLAIVKLAAARTNRRHGKLSTELFEAIERAALEVCEGKHNGEFPLVVWQTGSGTQSNMNVNEVIANRAIQLLGGTIGTKTPVHPNDHVNMGQSSNDTFPTAMHISVALQTKNTLIPALKNLRSAFQKFADSVTKVIKIGRTHLQDATPLTMGQEFEGYVACLDRAIKSFETVLPELGELPQGGTAVGTGLNTYESFIKEFPDEVNKVTGAHFFKTANNKFEALSSINIFVKLSGLLSTAASDLMKIANDIRLLGSGPRCGLGELLLPENEPGSSIMPGKVNPTQCEAMTMVCAQVIGNHTAVTIGNTYGHLQLNVMRPMVIYNILRSIRLISDASNSFTINCIDGLKVNHNKVEEHLNSSLMLVTALSQHIGYDNCAKLALHAHRNNLTLKEAALALNMVKSDEQFNQWVRPEQMILPEKR